MSSTDTAMHAPLVRDDFVLFFVLSGGAWDNAKKLVNEAACHTQQSIAEPLLRCMDSLFFFPPLSFFPVLLLLLFLPFRSRVRV